MIGIGTALDWLRVGSICTIAVATTAIADIQACSEPPSHSLPPYSHFSTSPLASSWPGLGANSTLPFASDLSAQNAACE